MYEKDENYMDIFGHIGNIHYVIYVIIGGFFAGFVDAIAGGGGLISLPVILATGMSPHLAIGTNKFSATFGALMSAGQFIRARKVDLHLLPYLIPFTLVGAIIGCVFMLHLSSKWLNPIIILTLLGTAAFVFFKPQLGVQVTAHEIKGRSLYKAMGISFLLGLYDGFIGPGTGTFLIVFFALLGYEFIFAAGNAKVLNLVSNLTSFIIFIALGNVYYIYGISMAISLFLGAFLGARLAIHKGNHFIRYVMLIVTCILICKLILQYLHFI